MVGLLRQMVAYVSVSSNSIVKQQQAMFAGVMYSIHQKECRNAALSQFLT